MKVADAHSATGHSPTRQSADISTARSWHTTTATIAFSHGFLFVFYAQLSIFQHPT